MCRPRPMKLRFVRFVPPAAESDCFFGMAELAVGTDTLLVENFFGADRETEGEVLDLEIRPNFTGLAQSWEEIFGGNLDQQTALVPLGGGTYQALGRIIAIKPLVADCGLIGLRVPLSSNDPRVIGEHVGFRITALAAYWPSPAVHASGHAPAP